MQVLCSTLDLCVFMYVYVFVQFLWRSRGWWVGTKPRDDRFTVLRTIANSPLCISLFLLHPHSVLLLHPSTSLIFLFSSPDFLFLSALHNTPQSSILNVCRHSLYSPLLFIVDHSSVWPLAFYKSNCFSGNQVLCFLYNIVLSGGKWFACRYDWKPAGSHRNEIKIGYWSKTKTINVWLFFKNCVDEVNWLGW